MTDIVEIRRTTRKADFDITELVESYILSCANKQWIERYLNQIGFEVHLHNKPDGSQEIRAYTNVYSSWSSIFSTEVQIVITLHNGVITERTGRAIFRSL